MISTTTLVSMLLGLVVAALIIAQACIIYALLTLLGPKGSVTDGSVTDGTVDDDSVDLPYDPTDYSVTYADDSRRVG